MSPFTFWNVERLRPADLEPFVFTRANVSCCLWFAEGFTDYYGGVSLARAGSGRPGAGLDRWQTSRIDRAASCGPSSQMSEHAPFTDLAVSNDMTDSRPQLRLVLHIRRGDRPRHWTCHCAADPVDVARSTTTCGVCGRSHGRAVGSRPGYVDRPYTLADLRATLAEVSGDRRFADEFFDRYIEGREVADYDALIAAGPKKGTSQSRRQSQSGHSPRRKAVAGSQSPASRCSTDRITMPVSTPAISDHRPCAGEPASAAAWNTLRQRKPGGSVTITNAPPWRQDRRQDARNQKNATLPYGCQRNQNDRRGADGFSKGNA